MTTHVSLEEVEAELANLQRNITKLRAKLQPLEQRYEEIRTTLKVMKEITSGKTTDTTIDIDRVDTGGQVRPTIAYYALNALRQKRDWLNTRDLISAMEELGYQSQASNPYTNVFSTLNRERERHNTEFTKLNGQWGLKEWEVEEESEETP